ncbi:GNAT family N-acetyltransferase [Salmonella enterica]|nr:GNAT family N-acetyltransferase [Salmonella enterica]
MLIRIEEIRQHHDRKSFDCGVPSLNQFLQQQTRQKAIKNIAKTYVACFDSEPETIAGYYTLSGYSVIVPPKFRHYKNYPHPLNAVKLARLAIHKQFQGKRIGEKLLVDAIYRTVLVANQVSAIGLFVDPTTQDVIPFYEQYGFLMAQSNHIEMWLPINTCKEVVTSFPVSTFSSS